MICLACACFLASFLHPLFCPIQGWFWLHYLYALSFPTFPLFSDLCSYNLCADAYMHQFSLWFNYKKSYKNHNDCCNFSYLLQFVYWLLYNWLCQLSQDGAAVTGLAIAAASLVAVNITGNAIYDPIGSIIVGNLLGMVCNTSCPWIFYILVEHQQILLVIYKQTLNMQDSICYYFIVHKYCLVWTRSLPSLKLRTYSQLCGPLYLDFKVICFRLIRVFHVLLKKCTMLSFMNF